MSRIAYVNGRYQPHRAAAVHIEDRGYQFADGVYEVVPVQRGKLIDEDLHLDRLEFSLGELEIAAPMERRALKLVLREVLRRNGIDRGILYMQVTRGVAPRDHKFPVMARPALVITAKRLKPVPAKYLEEGVGVITLPDLRWKRCDIKTIALLPNVLGKQRAAEEGAYEAWQVDPDGNVTEGTSTNAWIVTKDRKIVTRPLGHEILPGVTRRALLELLQATDFTLEERSFTLDEALAAAEAFLTSSSVYLLPITRIDGRKVGNGKPGEFSKRLRQLYLDHAERQATAA
ncbi:D-amino-acid transaminase [Dongia sedimenti]|uniref:Probable branched-chain-amino-acid aminotransferase n=1 Tax=Dongia sedimenti TaxID=3064282 RepID=A0ABU0YJX5_9PROT|nr:D-amino-acid transaminase [Rhodospirillaceae bacterium R-7]